MDDLDDICAEAWRDALLRTWFQIEDEGLTPVDKIAEWSGKKRSTVYDWRRGESAPDTWPAFRLSRNAAVDGYPELLSLLVPDSMRLAHIGGEVRVTGTLNDNLRDLAEIQARIARAMEAGSSKEIREVAKDLHDEADEIAAEATADFS